MNNTEVLILITADHWTPKNNLHKAINSAMKQINQTLTNKLVAERLIEKAIDQAHQENPRCKAINWHKMEERDESRTIYFLNCINVSLITVKHKLV